MFIISELSMPTRMQEAGIEAEKLSIGGGVSGSSAYAALPSPPANYRHRRSTETLTRAPLDTTDGKIAGHA